MRRVRMNKINVALVGYGSQGRRIAEAVFRQPDMRFLGLGLKEPDLSARMAFKKGFPIYAMSSEDEAKFKQAKIEVHGLLPKVLSRVDVVIDATPTGIGKKNKELYSKHGVKTIFQAGEKFDIADIPVFVCQSMYKAVNGAKSVRIPSPYTVSLFRTLDPMNTNFGIKNTNCTFIMPGAEPMLGQTDPVDTIIPDKPLLLQSIKNELMQIMPKPLMLSSFRVPSIFLGVGCMFVRLGRKFSLDDVINTLSKIPRIIIVKGDYGLNATDSILEYIRRISRSFADVYEVCVWHEQIEATENTLKLVQAFDPHCVQTPEIIDAVRALAGKEGMEESFKQTNKTLGILSPGVYP